MKKVLLLCASIFCLASVIAQPSFQNASNAYPLVPSGLLEAVSWTNTHMVNISGNAVACSGIPQPYGYMGLHDDGKGYFNETGAMVANLSGISIQDQKADPINQIMAYASAFNQQMLAFGATSSLDADAIRNALHSLSEIPDTGAVNILARDMQVYSILSFMNSPEKAQLYGFTPANISLKSVFGVSNYNVLSAKKIQLTPTEIKSEKGDVYVATTNKSLQYGPAIWNPAPTCNFSSRLGVAVSAITIHTVQGSYAGAISWAQNCSSDVSYHYVIRSSDGQVTQMVLEEDKAWHVGSENPYTIGYEHEGWVNNPSWYTEEMYNSSADLSRDIVNSGYGIPPLRTYDGPATSGVNVLGNCRKIKGHQHYPNQTHVDPGINWNWEKYYRLINDPAPLITLSASTGTVTDLGGASNDYGDDQRQLWLIQPPAALSITLDFSVFDLEYGYDKLFIYDGDTATAPLIGEYTGTNSPGIVISSGGSILLEFRSDCSTVEEGFVATWTETVADATPPATVIINSNPWHNDDFDVSFTDTDAQSGIDKRFYLAGRKEVSDNDWSSDGTYGFAVENFEDVDTNWTNITGTYSVNSGTFVFSDVLENNSNSSMSVAQTNTQAYLYEWDQTITSSSTNQRAGMHFFCDDATLPNRGNSYFVYLRENDDKVQIYSVNNDVFALEADIPFVINPGQTYNCKVYFDAVSGMIEVYLDDSLVGFWQDVAPLTVGNSISLRTGGCEATFDNIRVYQSRSTTATIPAGLTDLMYIESDGAVPTGMVRSLALDSAGNWSAPAVETFLVDFTAPEVNFLADGPSNDIDTFTTTTIEANWDVFDIQSGIGNYDVAIGTLPTFDNVVPWTSNGTLTTFSTVLASPVYDEVYHISLRATNQADLTNQFMSDGQRFIDNVSLDEINGMENIVLFPNPTTDQFILKNLPNSSSLVIYDMQGKECRRIIDVESGESIDIQDLSNGDYNVMIRSGQSFILKKLIIQ